MKEVTADYIRSAFSYDRKTGDLTRLTGPRAGSVSGTVAKDGYKIIRVAGKNYYAHRLAWLHVHGSFPSKHLDHIDGNRGNNSLENLRECTVSQNAQNRKVYRDNKTGLMGVTERRGRYIAQLVANGSRKLTAYCASAEEAHQLYLEAKRKFHTFQPEVRNI